MIKGVNRQVLEIPQPESDYFERVIFFVKPEYYGMGESRLREKAASMISKTIRPPVSQVGRRELRAAGTLRLILAAVLGGTAVFLLQLALR